MKYLKKSIFHKLIARNVMIFSIIFFIILSVFASYFCTFSRKKVINDATIYLDNYADLQKASIASAVQLTEYITKNETILDGLKADASLSIMEAYTFSTYIDDYLDILSASNDFTVKIFTKNDTLMSGKYISHISSDEFDYYKNLSTANNLPIAWDGNIPQKNNYENHFVFWRYVPIAECMISITVNTPIHANTYECAFATKEILDNNKAIAVEVFPELYVYDETAMNSLKIIYFTIFLVFISIFALVCGTAFAFTYISSTKITLEINQFLQILGQNAASPEKMVLVNQSDESNEIAIIKNVLINLIDQVKLKSRQHYDSIIKISQLNYELQQLKFNPHLLYNSLSLINLIAYKKNDYETIEIVDLLSDYYHTILRNYDHDPTLTDELLALDKYIKVNELATKMKVELITEIETELDEICVPPLILQPFVENSINHGFTHQQESRIIKLTIQRENNDVTITICDNGIGISPETLSLLNNIENNKFGYGIRNTYERLRIYFNGNSKIHFDSIPYECTTAKIEFTIS